MDTRYNTPNHGLSLPMEIWHQIAGEAGQLDQRALLFVSRLHRRVALGALFRHVKIHFGQWERVRPINAQPDANASERARRQAIRSHGILSAIIQEPALAYAVKELWIFCYTESGLSDEEVDLMGNGVQALPHLLEFRWFGTYPHLPLPVAQALAGSCRQLRHLRFPANQNAHSVPQALRSLRELRTLVIVCQVYVDNAHGYNTEEISSYRNDMCDLITANTAHLTRLTVYSELLSNLTEHSFDSLIELVIWGPRDEHLLHLGNLLSHMRTLEGLALVELMGCNEALPLLFEKTESWPALTQLKIMSIDEVHDARAMNALAKFINAHPQLKRLDIDLPGLARDDLLNILDAISTLEQLDAYGIDLRSITDPDDLNLIANYLPTTPMAVHLQFCWDNIPFTEDYSMGHLMRKLASMPRLEFLHLQTMYAANQTAAEELAFAIPNLITVGLAAQFYSIANHDGSHPRVKLYPWAYRDVALRSERSLGSVAEWLMRFHNLLESLD